jgi:lysophospholipase L1-like esterase
MTRPAPEPIHRAALRASANFVSRGLRWQTYQERLVENPHRMRIVAEGDSWFQYPFVLTDIVDHLLETFAIRCVSSAGDTLADLLASKDSELLPVIAEEQARICILSVGGNDLIGEGVLLGRIRDYHPDLNPAAYFNEAFDHALSAFAELLGQYAGRIFERCPEVRVLIHSYDYVIPAGQRWLGQPMRARGIIDPALQREIARSLIDRFHSAMAQVAERVGPERLVLVDCRGAVPEDEWYDELHPNEAGFARIADRFRQRLLTIS